MTKIHKGFWSLSMITAPLLTGIAQFYWHNGVLTVTAGVLQVWSYFFWIFAFHGMFELLKEKTPMYAWYGFIVAVLSCLGGNNFGVDGIYSSTFFEISDTLSKINLHDKIGIATQFYLFIPGLLFPISLLVLAFMLGKTKTIPTGLSLLLGIAALGFPLSRIPRIDLIAHLDNVLLVVAHAWILLYILKGNTNEK